MPDSQLVQDLHSLTPTSFIELFTLDTSDLQNNNLPLGQRVLNFHNSKESKTGNSVFFGDPLVQYAPIPILMKNNEIKGDNSLPRPRLTIGNPDGIVSYYIRQSGGMVNATLTRRKTLAKYLHENTWGGVQPFGVHQPESYLTDDIYFVNKIVVENKEIVEFELASVLETQGIKLPRTRMYATSCRFEYRNSSGCGFNGIAPEKSGVDHTKPVATEGNVTFEGDLGLTLVDRGEWSATNTYNIGDFVKITSRFDTDENVPHSKKFFFYVCKKNGVVGPAFYPPISKDSWYKEACSKKISGCLLRYEPNQIRIGAFPGLIRTDFQ